MTIGVILCGGLSTRMKSDKGLVSFGGVSFLEVIYDSVIECFDSVVVSINSSQVDAYTARFLDYKFVVDSSDEKGPINGILSVHKQYPSSNLLVVPCDMIKLDKSFLLELESLESQVYKEVEIQPFPMFVTSDKLKEISEVKLERYSLKYIIEEFKIKSKDISSDNRFFNANSMSDL
tara:strand:- start:587 stop:1117 length:531 start_codon:yes stop_codon:yes gene_type:complete